MTRDGEQRSTSETTASPAQPGSNWTASRVIGLVFASIGGLIGLALLVGGAKNDTCVGGPGADTEKSC